MVSSITFKTHKLPSVYINRSLISLDALCEYFQVTPKLPNNISVSAVMGPLLAQNKPPVLYLCGVYCDGSKKGQQLLDKAVSSIGKGHDVYFKKSEIVSYLDISPFDVPSLTGKLLEPPPPCQSVDARVFVYVKSCFLKKPIDDLGSKIITNAVRNAPNSLCRFDLQHCGGVVGHVKPNAMAFWNRDFEWSIVITGAWLGSTQVKEKTH